MSSALLGEPFLLANYPIPSQNFPKSVGPSKTIANRYIKVSGGCSKHGEGFATVTVQGDGVHVLELSNMHTTISHTLGPSAFFTTSSVTRFNSSDTSSSYAVMRTASGRIETADRDKTVWKWRDRHTRRPEEQPEPKQAAVFPRCVEELWAPSGLPSNVIAISPSGDVILSDDDLKVMSSIEVPYSQSTLLKSFVFGSEECAFLPHRFGQPLEMVVVCFIMVASHLKLRILLAQSTGELEEVTECDLGVYEDVISISCDPSGYTSILAQRGDWWLLRLDHDSANAVTATPLSKTLCLTGMSLVLPSNRGKWNGCEPSVISVGSSFVLLAGISGDDPAEIVLLLWDIQYSVVLASQRYGLPSTIGSSPRSPPILELVPVSRSQALLVLSPKIVTTSIRMTSAVAGRSTVLVVPLAIPPASTIALSMGKVHDTRVWLRNMHTDSTHTTISDQDRDRCQVMQSVQQALEQGRPHAAEAAFFKWVEQGTSRHHRLRKVDAPSDGKVSENPNDSVAASMTHPKIPQREDRWKRPSSPLLSHQFVSKLLNEILLSSQPSDATSLSKIVQYLIGQRAVSHAMVEGGLLPALRHHRYWDSIASALNNVHDLPEGDIVRLLLEVVRLHRPRPDAELDGMQVGTPSDVPSLPNFLAMVVVYKSSPMMLRSALKMHFTDALDISCILGVLEGWLAWWCNTNPGLAFDLPNLVTDGAQTSNRKGSNARRKTPSLTSVITFLQSVLDVHFLTLLHYTPSHSVIERISGHLREQLLSVNDLDRLRGPLEAFVRAQSQSFARRPELESGGNSRQRRREAFEAAELVIGPYQIEKLVI